MARRPSGSSPPEDVQDRTDGRASGETRDGGWAFATQEHYDPADARELTTVIVDAIAEAEGVAITDIKEPPLYDVVDVAAIDHALFDRPDVNRDRTESKVEFRYDEYLVTVEADGWVTVSRRSDGSTIG